MKRLLPLIALGLTFVTISGCLDSKPKVLGKSKPNIGKSDTSSSSSFKFNFAFRDTTAAAPLDKIIYIQGSANSKTPILSTCNSAGTNCVCEFLDSSGNEIEESDAASGEISYDQTGNYIRCDYDGVIANLASIRVRNQNSTVISSTLPVDTTLTVQKLIGTDLDVNLVRTVYRYECIFKYLQKVGTTTSTFDCSNQGSTCWNTTVPAASGDFCMIRSDFPFYVFSDNYSTNLSLKVADKLYNQGTSGTVCGLQIKQFDCAQAGGTPVKQFGLFGQQVGIFDTAVQLSAAPDVSASTYGFAAKTSTFLGQTVCPPGMVRRIFYQATTNTTILSHASNYPNAQNVLEIASPTAAAFGLAVNKYRGGDCDGATCSEPTSLIPPGDPDEPIWPQSFSYTSTGSEFCVIPGTLLP